MTEQKRGPVLEHVPQVHDRVAYAAWQQSVIARARTLKSDAEVAAFGTQAGGVGAARFQALVTSPDPVIKLSGYQVNQLYENYKYVGWVGDTASGQGHQTVDGESRTFTADWHGEN